MTMFRKVNDLEPIVGFGTSFHDEDDGAGPESGYGTGYAEGFGDGYECGQGDGSVGGYGSHMSYAATPVGSMQHVTDRLDSGRGYSSGFGDALDETEGRSIIAWEYSGTCAPLDDREDCY